MASNTGMNRIGNLGGELLLSLTPTSSGVGLDSGIQMTEAIGCKEFTFQLVGPGANAAGYSVTCYGTTDQAAYAYGKAVNPSQPTIVYPNTPAQQTIYGQGKGSTALPITSWVVLPGPSEQSGTGVMGNPMVSGSAQILKVTLLLVAIRVVATLTGPTLPVQVLCFASS